MTNIPLTNNQRAILNAASRSANLVAWPLPKRLKLSVGSAGVVIHGLIKKGLLEKRPAMGADPIWKEEGGKQVTLVISRTGLIACGMSSADEMTTKGASAANRATVAAVSPDEARMPRAGSKLALLVELLQREEGATIMELAHAIGWQPHSVRGVMSGMLVTKFDLHFASEKVEDRGRVYKLKEKP